MNSASNVTDNNSDSHVSPRPHLGSSKATDLSVRFGLSAASDQANQIMDELETKIGQSSLYGEAECETSQNTPRERRKRGDQSEETTIVPTSDSGSQEDPEELSTLGWSCFDRFQRFEELDDLEEMIKNFLRALALTREGDPALPGRHEGLGVSYGCRFQRLGEFEDLEKAIGHFSYALALTPNDHPDMPRRHDDLSLSYGDRFRRLGDPKDIEKSIEHRSRALSLTPNDHPDMPLRCAGLGVSYGHRFKRLGELPDLEKAIEQFSRALTLTPNDDPDIPRRHDDLGVSYGDRFLRLGELEDLEKSIENYSRALVLTPNGHPRMPRRHAGLGVSYGDRFWRLGKPEDIEKSIEHISRALALTPHGHPDMPSRHEDLSLSYSYRFQRLGDPIDLEESVDHISRALALTHNGHPDMPRRLHALGVSYGDRFRRLGELEDLEKSIEHFSRALTLTPNGHPDMPNRHEDLSLSYVYRFRRLDKPEDIEKSIEHISRALQLTPNDHPHVPRRHAGLGMSYGDRFRRLGKPQDLEKAIEHYSRALALTPNGDPDISDRYDDLGGSYGDRFQLLGEPKDLEKSIEYHSRGLELAPNEHPHLPRQHSNLAHSYIHQFQRTGDLSFSNKALHHFRSASQRSSGPPRDRFQFALQWANLASTYGLLNSLEAYQTTIGLLPQFIWLGATTTQRYQDLSAAENLAVNAANAAIRSSNYVLALEWLEHARCVVWAQILMLRSPLDQLHSSHPDLATRLQIITRQLHSGSFRPEQALQQRRRLALEYESLLAQARQLTSFEDFLQPMKASGLISAAKNGPVIVINSHSTCCDALVIVSGRNNVEHLHLPNFNNKKAQRARADMTASLKRKGIRERGVKSLHDLNFRDRIESVLETLWNDVVCPVLDFLGYMNNDSKESLPHITWCPTGALSFLPLHAAGDYKQPRSRVFDYAISSYTPTLTALLGSPPSSVSHDYRVLAVGQPNTPGRNQLPGATIELASVQAYTQGRVEYTQLVGDQATTTAVLDAMEQHDWVHLACHAHQNLTNPTKSGFFLHDGTLDLAAINRRSFKNKGLAFLSACQTATGDDKLPDEAVHLASGMLMAGYPSVIATMWSVGDTDAPLVADKVYAELMKEGKIGNGEAGKALHLAVAALRDKVGEKEFGRWVPYIHIGS